MSVNRLTSGPEVNRVPKTIRFVFGGCAGMLATSVVQPMDLVKTRMQVSGGGSAAKTNPVTLAANIIRKEGVIALYNGLSAGLLRQATYSTVSLGAYFSLMDTLTTDGRTPNFVTKLFIGMASGAVGAFVGNPAEVALIRMTADGRLPVTERRNYKNVVNALVRITREEGVLTLWRGCLPTVARAMTVNATKLATYSQAKQFLLTTGYFADNAVCHVTCALIASLVNALASLPLDIAKTRLQNMRTIDGRPEYKGVVDVIVRLVRYEGLSALWKGFTPYYGRLGPHAVILFFTLEQFQTTYIKFVKQLE